MCLTDFSFEEILRLELNTLSVGLHVKETTEGSGSILVLVKVMFHDTQRPPDLVCS